MTLDPVTLSVMASALSGVAEEMGALLIRAAYSSNIKERRDCSTALFDADGVMVAQAEHIPVHLGAMPEAVEAVMERDPRPGDVFVVNDPYSGGTHLPDITMISSLSPDGASLGFAVTRAHHSDVGGMRAGSMPGDSREIFQEGLVIPPVRLVREGVLDEDVLDLILANSRTPELRRGDLMAQAAANRLASERIQDLVGRGGSDTVRAAFREVVKYTERMARHTIRSLPSGRYTAESEIEGDGVMEEDIPIRVAVEIEDDRMHVDFTGTAGAVQGNVNCPLSVTRSACYFAFRVLLPIEIPANAGAYRPISIHAPEGSLVNARQPSAVVAGNVETSQRIADTVLIALSAAADVPAQGQGTMNNLVIGSSRWTYYETLGGGQGASSKGDGDSGVHVGMTNTLNTPIEALELEYPLRVERYELVYGTGGSGLHRGGDGLVRAVRVGEDATLSLLTDRRRHAPAGARAGGPGTGGKNLVGDEEVPAKGSRELRAGEEVTIFTPGGGGWGDLTRRT